MFATAKAYLQGFGTPVDIDAAKKWLKLAINAGSKEAKALLQKL